MRFYHQQTPLYMIVPTMTIEEVHHELLYDYDCIKRKSQANAKLYLQEMLRKGLHQETHTVKYISPRKTEWIILYMIDVRQIQPTFYTVSADNRGKVAYQLVFHNETKDIGITKYNTHFFKRYRERQHPHLNNPGGLISHFFKHNPNFTMGQSQEIEDGRCLTHCVLTEGIGLGWIDQQKKVVNLKTFLPHHMLGQQQKDFTDYILHHNDGEEFRLKINQQAIRHKIK